MPWSQLCERELPPCLAMVRPTQAGQDIERWQRSRPLVVVVLVDRPHQRTHPHPLHIHPSLRRDAAQSRVRVEGCLHPGVRVVSGKAARAEHWPGRQIVQRHIDVFHTSTSQKNVVLLHDVIRSGYP
jgi:hypothetical protein